MRRFLEPIGFVREPADACNLEGARWSEKGTLQLPPIYLTGYMHFQDEPYIHRSPEASQQQFLKIEGSHLVHRTSKPSELRICDR